MEMGNKWRKMKVALGLNLCVNGPKNYIADSDEDEPVPPSEPPSEARSNAALLSLPADFTTYLPKSASKRLTLSKSFNRSSSKKSCSICLTSMRRGDGQAIFTAECSHSFHFQCIVSNVKHGNRICPVCRAKWKDIPLQGPSVESPPQAHERVSPVNWTRNNGRMRIVRGMPPPRSNSSRNMPSLLPMPEPAKFDDDEMLELKTDSKVSSILSTGSDVRRKVSIKAFTEVSSVPRSNSVDSFTVLLNLKAPCSNSWHNTTSKDDESQFPELSQTPRAPVDLVTVLDTSGSMAGNKLALLKRAMGFVIQNLGPNDRLAVISFSSTARRLFPLRRMSEAGRQQALQAVNSLIANGGTNIAEGLRKGAKIMEDRKEKNSICSIILLSDGQDTYTVNNITVGRGNIPNYQLLLPSSIRPDEASGFKIPVHAFGFGADHDASAMHSISEISGGTFSFIETEGVIQDAFAQCIGGLLSVVVKDLHLTIESGDPAIRIGSLKAGSYPNRVFPNRRVGSIDVGDLYADEERDFLISINVPRETSSSDEETYLLKVRCVYIDPLTEESVTVEGEEVRVKRSDMPGNEDISIEVDRQRNRVQAAEAMTQARAAAESGDMAGAVIILENIRKLLLNSVSGRSQDRLCISLDAELKEMQERMASRHAYEVSGRAYILSGLSSHSWQRATARGDSTDFSSLVQAYQTPSMVEMVTRSQAASLGSSPSAQRLLRPVWSFGSERKPG